jgi:hypothetical protein
VYSDEKLLADSVEDGIEEGDTKVSAEQTRLQLFVCIINTKKDAQMILFNL